MNSKQSTMQSARKKLVAATAMLLVACIMTISSTYAWFTLSTAPEVKGITTNVGANGNLEIALGTYDTVYGTSEPASYEGSSIDATADATVSNITWGNLINLSDLSYGLGDIVLYPSRLNATITDGKGYIANTYSPLAYAIYGSDGRVMNLSANTLLGKYEMNTGFMALETPTYAGVNAIGSASNMSEREFAGRNYKNAVESNRLTARNEALGAINLYSGDLAGLAINNLSSGDDAVVAEADIAVLKNLIAKLKNASAAIDASLKSAMMVVLTAQTSLSDDAWELAVNTIGNKTASETLTYLEDEQGVDLSGFTEITDVIDDNDAIAEDLADAEAVLPESGDSTWGTVSTAVSAILNTTGIEICGEDVMSVKNNTDGARDRVMQEVLSGDGLTFSFAAGSGVFADIADFVGNYTGTISFPDGVVVEGVNLSGVKKPVEVKGQYGATGLLGGVHVLVKDSTIPGAQTGTEKALTDTYGYTVDLLFRTNATDSYLELQTNAANRVYSDNDNAELMGAGSNMAFTLGGEYTEDKIDGLAEGIRVVFYDTTSGEIYGVAKLDTENGTVSGDQYKLDLKLANFTVNPANNNIPSALAVGDFLTDNTADTTKDESVALTALTANQVKKVTALVYLDGDVIDNGDAGVAANLNGKLNLQFASSATLTPMSNSNLENYSKGN
ncbi:MAG: hypothetical protein IJD71_04565 [Clostridia bacterium]|nr:hypothetical protein [Clostridia bacterium]MBQ9919586.1 hypothetical protein [Clostridia bacterium]